MDGLYGMNSTEYVKTKQEIENLPTMHARLHNTRTNKLCGLNISCSLHGPCPHLTQFNIPDLRKQPLK